MINFDKALESISKIKLTGGIFGKTTVLLIVFCICVAAVCLKLGDWQFALILMLPLMAIVFYALKRCLDFAEKNPFAAIMDGAELLVHERMLHGKKDKEFLIPSGQEIEHPLPPNTEAEAIIQDPPTVAAIEDNSSNSGKED